MVDSEYSMGIYKSANISIGIVMRNLEMLKLVPEYLKTKKMCKNAVKKLDTFMINIKLNNCVIKLF